MPFDALTSRQARGDPERRRRVSARRATSRRGKQSHAYCVGSSAITVWVWTLCG